MAEKSSGLFYIDSLIAFNEKDTLLIDDFEEYDTITDVMMPIITDDKEWGIDCPTGRVIKMSILYRKNGKCFKVWYSTSMGVYFFLKFNTFQDYSKYNTLQLTISRNQHPDSTAIIKKGEILNKNADVIKIGANNTILYKVPPGNQKTVIVLYSISGRKIKTLFNGYKQEGEYSLSLKEQKVSHGLYYIRASFGEKNITQKVAIVR